jgi:hypothetical protein
MSQQVQFDGLHSWDGGSSRNGGNYIDVMHASDIKH